MIFRKHWHGFALLFLGLIYLGVADAFYLKQMYGLAEPERQALARAFPMNILLGSIPVMFWGCLILFMAHSFLLRQKGWVIMWLKFAFIPIYWVVTVMMFFHVE